MLRLLILCQNGRILEHTYTGKLLILQMDFFTVQYGPKTENWKFLFQMLVRMVCSLPSSSSPSSFSWYSLNFIFTFFFLFLFLSLLLKCIWCAGFYLFQVCSMVSVAPICHAASLQCHWLCSLCYTFYHHGLLIS